MSQPPMGPLRRSCKRSGATRASPGARNRRSISIHVGAAFLFAMLLSSCAHTKPTGQALVAIGALTLGFGALDAAGVLGSDCHTSTPIDSEAVSSCGGDGVVPQEVDVLSIGIGAGLVAAGVLLWTQDSPRPPSNASARSDSDRELAELRTESVQTGESLPARSPLHVAELHCVPYYADSWPKGASEDAPSQSSHQSSSWCGLPPTSDGQQLPSKQDPAHVSQLSSSPFLIAR